jgi:hypothetical protein
MSKKDIIFFHWIGLSQVLNQKWVVKLKVHKKFENKLNLLSEMCAESW